MKTILLILSLICIAFGSNCRNYVSLQAVTGADNRVTLSADISGIKNRDTCYIYRSYLNMEQLGVLDLQQYPISKRTISCRDSLFLYVDSMTANNCTYFYYGKVKTLNGRLVPIAQCSVSVGDVSVPHYRIKKAAFLIDKKNYFLELRLDDVTVKRYPINLGTRPWNRKLHFDRMSSPEGTYRITHFNNKSAFHKSMGVSYPNAVDRRRYEQAKRRRALPLVGGKIPHIGGSITIHGGGIGNNWTWGCIAMRNEDVDDLLSLPAVKVGVPVYIIGNEVKRKDLIM